MPGGREHHLDGPGDVRLVGRAVPTTERATDGIAASWKTTSQPAIAASRAAGSRIEPVHERDPVADRVDPPLEPGREVVDDGDLVAALQEGADEVVADEAGAAGDEGPHRVVGSWWMVLACVNSPCTGEAPYDRWASAAASSTIRVRRCVRSVAAWTVPRHRPPVREEIPHEAPNEQMPVTPGHAAADGWSSAMTSRCCLRCTSPCTGSCSRIGDGRA